MWSSRRQEANCPLCISQGQPLILISLNRDRGSLLATLQAENPELQVQSRSWDDVVEVMEEAEAEYELKGSKNKARRLLRNGETVAKVLQSLAEFIPDEKGLSVLRGGIVLLCSVSVPAISY